ncbi:MAG: DUF4835 family protein [Prolixibacteraceae bacterium]|nr:DUF4835 family protein [Prolixibacteraceae bacterium]
MKKLIPILVFLFLLKTGYTQELRCNISVNANKITGVNKNIFRSMQMDLYDFMNNRKWTNHSFKTNERIECSINIQLDKQISGDEYSGIITVQSKRSAFDSSYKTTVLNIRDEYFRINYQEFQTIEFIENGNKDNLTSTLAYYAYIILGFDYDTYELNGGTEYFEKARQIVNDSQNYPVTTKGWKAFESDYNRYWIVENILNSSYSSFRECIYMYHRKGLDTMAESVESGRAEIAEALRLIQKVFRARSRLYITQLFFDSKSNELVSIFSNSYPDEQNRVVQILSECDPTNANKYGRIKKGSELNPM